MKISKSKRKNQESAKNSKKGRKVKKTSCQKNSRKNHQKKQVLKQPDNTLVEEEIDLQDLMEMTDIHSGGSLKHLFNKSKKDIHNRINSDKKKNSSSELEDRFEESLSRSANVSDADFVKLLLPTKNKDGVIQKHLMKQSYEEQDVSKDEKIPVEDDFQQETDIANAEPIPTIKLLAAREKKMKMFRYRIGLLSSEILENPEGKLKYLSNLLKYMDEKSPEVYVSVRKLSTASLLEIFKDVLPYYNIRVLDKTEGKLKKETLNLLTHETSLVKYYKQYLLKLEKMARCLKKGRDSKQQDIFLGVFALKCMCNLLTSNPYFNFSSNIANFLVPFLNDRNANIRKIVKNCISQLFREDRRGEITLSVVRRLNQYIKIRKNMVHLEVTTVLLDLQISHIDLDKEKDEANKYKKLMNHKKRIIALSKKERKRKKKLSQVEKELLETKGQEDKSKKQRIITDITSLLFTIYFRILKQSPNSKVLSSCLEGLSKFAHCINIDFYEDLIGVLNKLLNENSLPLKEQLHCIHVASNILSGQNSMLNIDPIRFYTHLYKNLFNIHIGKSHSDTNIVIQTLLEFLIRRCKNITQNRLLAFTKRMSMMTLNSYHNSALGILLIIKLIFQYSKPANILLDTDCSIGDGIYSPELDDPEYCNAQCSSLWEVVALQRHYHPTVKTLSSVTISKVLSGEDSQTPSEIAKMTPMDAFIEYNPMDGSFKPTTQLPRKLNNKSFYKPLLSSDVQRKIDDTNINNIFEDSYIDFYKELRIR